MPEALQVEADAAGIDLFIGHETISTAAHSVAHILTPFSRGSTSWRLTGATVLRDRPGAEETPAAIRAYEKGRFSVMSDGRCRAKMSRVHYAYRKIFQ